ncbi:unnamed protein product [Paramecium sonneborni]|uniref:Protein kinase domain-containing protein n=1 Tax=Paramecium sonneborni TaxID=65129 RepID=A0A8S1NI53_9CILI|nr:unnamed protein product [Paramecium sonneborni]
MSWQEKYIKIQEEIEIGQIGEMEIHKNKKTGEIYNMKIINCQLEKQKQTKNILDQVKRIRHPNIVVIEDIFEDDKGSFYIYMKKADTNLQQIFGEIQQDQAALCDFIKQLVPQIIDGYCRLMEENIIHRNLKPQNILCKIKDKNKYIFQICSFDHSKIINMSKDYDMTQFQELFYYSAPDLQKDDYINKCDVYSFGLILAELIFGRQFTDHEKQQLPMNQLINNFPQQIIDLVQQMLVLDHKNRVSWTELKLKYFYPKYDWNKTCVLQKVEDINSNKVCIKQISKMKNGSCNNELNEILINLKIKNCEEKNDNIIKILEVLNEKDYEYAYIIMEQCDGDLGQLKKTQGIFNKKQILNLIKQVNNGYKFLINNRIVHRDIKPENILYLKINHKYCYKIIDFQYSFDQMKNNYSASSKTGTSKYQAPEVNGKDNYDFQCDIYSLGLVILEMATNITNLEEKDIEYIHDKLKEDCCIIDIFNQYPFKSYNIEIDYLIQDLLKQMIKYDPKTRINWEVLYQEIRKFKKQLKYQQQETQNNNRKGQIKQFEQLNQNTNSSNQPTYYGWQQKNQIFANNQQSVSNNEIIQNPQSQLQQKQQFNFQNQFKNETSGNQNSVDQIPFNVQIKNQIFPNNQQSVSNNQIIQNPQSQFQQKQQFNFQNQFKNETSGNQNSVNQIPFNVQNKNQIFPYNQQSVSSNQFIQSPQQQQLYHSFFIPNSNTQTNLQNDQIDNVTQFIEQFPNPNHQKYH